MIARQPALSLAAACVLAQATFAQNAAVQTPALPPETPQAQVQPPPTPPPATAPPTVEDKRWSLQLNLDITNEYFYHGILQQNNGVIFQPYANFALTLFKEGDFKVDALLGTWNSLGQNAGTQTADFTKYWYECDLTAGVMITADKFSFKTTYTFLTSPSNAYQTVQELDLTLAYDDSSLLGAFALHPYAMVGLETGGAASDGNAPGMHNGGYLELGIAPGFNIELGSAPGSTPVAITFPVSVGLSLYDYYENAAGSNDVFGFAQVGVKANIPLPFGDSCGKWSMNAGVAGLFLGDNTAAVNGGQHAEVIGTLGIQVNF